LKLSLTHGRFQIQEYPLTPCFLFVCLFVFLFFCFFVFLFFCFFVLLFCCFVVFLFFRFFVFLFFVCFLFLFCYLSTHRDPRGDNGVYGIFTLVATKCRQQRIGGGVGFHGVCRTPSYFRSCGHFAKLPESISSNNRLLLPLFFVFSLQFNALDRALDIMGYVECPDIWTLCKVT
jgi:hypothetical protein